MSGGACATDSIPGRVRASSPVMSWCGEKANGTEILHVEDVGVIQGETSTVVNILDGK